MKKLTGFLDLSVKLLKVESNGSCNERAMKGLLAGVRGVVSGKLAVKQAQTNTARKEAMIALENRRQNMEDAKVFFDQVRSESVGGEKDKIEQERLDDLNTDYEETEEDLSSLEDDFDMETEPDKRKMVREKIEAKRSRLYRVASRLSKRESGMETGDPKSADPSPKEEDKKKPVKKGLMSKVFGRLGKKKK